MLDPMRVAVNMGRQEYSPQRVFLACTIWGAAWSHKRIQVLCDNAVVIEIINTKQVSVQISCTYSDAFTFSRHTTTTLQAVHVPGVLNVAADAISRNRPQVLRRTVPNVQPRPDRVPQTLWKILVLAQPDWMSVSWKALLTSYVKLA